MSISFETIMAFFGGIAVIAGGVKVIVNMFSPFKKLCGRMDKCENRLDEHDRYFTNDKQAIEKVTDMAKDNIRVNIALLNHMVDGNGVEEMKKLRKEIQDKIL